MVDFGQSCTAADDGSLMIRLVSAEDKRDVMKRLADSYDIDEIRVFEPSLNDIFVEYAGDSVE